MSPNLALIVVAGVLVAAGVYLLLERSMTRILVGVLLASNGVNVLFLVASGKAGEAPFVGGDPSRSSDPLPQAMVLTAIVITLGVSSFLLTLAYRSFQLNGHDEVADDVEDARIRQLALDDLESQSFDTTDTSLPDEEGLRLDRPEDEAPPGEADEPPTDRPDPDDQPDDQDRQPDGPTADQTADETADEGER